MCEGVRYKSTNLCTEKVGSVGNVSDFQKCPIQISVSTTIIQTEFFFVA
jgi:hypothetical protein